MNTLTRNTLVLAIASAAFAAFGSNAYAQEATYELPQPAVSAKSRADVRAELLQARAEGTLVVTEADFQKQPAFIAGKSRALVAAEVRADAGWSQALNAEPQGFDAPRATLRPTAARVIAAAR